MKVAKPTAKSAAVMSASDQMESRGFNPIQRLMDMVDMEVDEPNTGDPEIDKAVTRSMLCTDFEPAKTIGKLALRSRLKAEILMELARYQHPRLKATETLGDVNVGIRVEVKTYAEEPKPVVEIR